jgi:hypothetical protein
VKNIEKEDPLKQKRNLFIQKYENEKDENL